MMNEKFEITRRRNRMSTHIRELNAAVQLSHKKFIQPLFVDESLHSRTSLPGLLGIWSDTIETVMDQIDLDLKAGISKFLVFPIPRSKSNSDFDYSFALQTIRSIKQRFGNQVWIAMDICLCAYTSHGHCGMLNEAGDKINNEASVRHLTDYGTQLAKAGADCLAPSDMMDGRIESLRKSLNDLEYDDVTILSYSAKFSSGFYGPFREACKSSPENNPQLKDRRSYQVSSYNKNDAVLSALRDINEGADIVMVKPGVTYMDIIVALKEQVKTPVAAYHVSGEYQALELLALHSGETSSRLHIETWTSLNRAGADIIISYAARYAKEWIEAIEY